MLRNFSTEKTVIMIIFSSKYCLVLLEENCPSTVSLTPSNNIVISLTPRRERAWEGDKQVRGRQQSSRKQRLCDGKRSLPRRDVPNLQISNSLRGENCSTNQPLKYLIIQRWLTIWLKRLLCFSLVRPKKHLAVCSNFVIIFIIYFIAIYYIIIVVHGLFFVCFFSEHAFWTSTDARCRSWTRLLLGHELPETFTFTFARLWTTRYMYINYYCRSWTTRARARQPSSAPGASRTCWPSCWILCPSPSYRLSRVSVLHNVKVKVVFKVRVNWVKSRSRIRTLWPSYRILLFSPCYKLFDCQRESSN